MRDRPHPTHKLEWPGGVVPEWARPKGNAGKRFGKGRGKKGGPAAGKRERLQKVMAQSGYGSRRNIEILIAQGHLTINGQVAKLGDSVGPGDKVKLDGSLINLRFGEALPRVLIYHKPDNEIVTRDDPEKRATVFDRLPKVQGGRWVSVGRLDLNTSGLLLFTTSGELANRLTHPRFEVEREYAVRIMGELTEELKDKLLTGVDIDGESCKFDSIEDRGGEGSNHWYHVVLREGKNREVRRMMEAVGMMVSRLMRVRFGPVQLPGHIKRGMFRDMEEEQVQELLAFAGMNEPAPGEKEAVEEESEDDNFGNRIELYREPRQREIDDDIGNKVPAGRGPREPQHEPDGNRGTYVPGGAPGNAPPKGPPRPASKPFAFGKKRRQGHGGQPRGEADGNRQPEGNRQPPEGNRQPDGNRQHRKPPGQGNVQAGGGQPQPPRGPRPHGQAQGVPGQGKPGRNRRNKNRNRGRRNEGQAAAEQQPAGNTNADPFNR